MTPATARPPSVAVNGRFRGRPVTGVERYAHELVARLPAALGHPPTVLAPRAPVRGVRGHAWEQAVLPRRFRGSGCDVLVSLCNFGPVTVPRQVVVIHDVAPFLEAGGFDGRYRWQARRVQRLLARRAVVATVSQRSRQDLAGVLGCDPATVAVVPPAVGAPFAPGPRDELPEPSCLLVGGHDDRKNAAFLLGLWPRVHAATGLHLHVTARAEGGTLRHRGPRQVPGVTWHHDPDDRALARLYRSVRFVVSPSRHEGFGLPLLEAMACGTPFLATDTGAAAELAMRPDEQLLPLDAEAWVRRLEQWSVRDLVPLGHASREHAAAWTWQASAAALVAALARVPGAVTAGWPPTVPARRR